MKLVSVKNLKFLDKLNIDNLVIYKGVNTFITGDKGKTLLLKCINNEVKYKGNIKKTKNTLVLFDRLKFYTNSVEDELKYILLSEEEKEMVRDFHLDIYLSMNGNTVPFLVQKLILIVEYLLKKPDVLFIDNVFTFLDDEDKKKIIKYAKMFDVTLVVISKDIEDSLYFPYTIILDKGSIAIEGKTEQVLKEDKLLKRLGVGIPFYIDLSMQLMLYNLIDKEYLNKEDLGDALWK